MCEWLTAEQVDKFWESAANIDWGAQTNFTVDRSKDVWQRYYDKLGWVSCI